MSIINKIFGRMEIVEFAENRRDQVARDLITAEEKLAYYDGIVKVLRKQKALLDGHVVQGEQEAEDREVRANLSRITANKRQQALADG